MGGSAVSWDGGGGGGGWYGGSAGQGCQDSGGGGSGFALNSSSYEIAKKQSKYAISKNYFLTNAKVIAGNEKMYGFGSLDIITGNTGNGKAKITLLHHTKEPTCSPKMANRFFIFVVVFGLSC